MLTIIWLAGNSGNIKILAVVSHDQLEVTETDFSFTVHCSNNSCLVDDRYTIICDGDLAKYEYSSTSISISVAPNNYYHLKNCAQDNSFLITQQKRIKQHLT